MPLRETLAAAALVASVHCAGAQKMPSAAAPPQLQRIERRDLCVTNGAISTLGNGRLAIDTPSSRAVVRILAAQAAEIRFRYLGPSEGTKPLGSGELRRQIGLKLRAQDTCNLLYAMWHIEPDAKIAVAVKRNPGKRTHPQCHDGGYVPIKARTSKDLPKIRAGESHTLRAELHGNDLTLVADGRVVWEGAVGNSISDIDGPVGLRTDNARFELEYHAARAGPEKPPDQSIRRCVPDR